MTVHAAYAQVGWSNYTCCCSVCCTRRQGGQSPKRASTQQLGQNLLLFVRRNQRSTAKATHVHVSDQSVTASLHEGVPWNLFPIWLVLYGLVLTVQERKRSFDALRKNWSMGFKYSEAWWRQHRAFGCFCYIDRSEWRANRDNYIWKPPECRDRSQ